jgi:hypothetical protein
MTWRGLAYLPLVLCLACGPSEKPRRTPFPRFEHSRLFDPTDSARADAPSKPGTSGAPSAFDRALAAADGTSAAQPAEVQAVLLASAFYAELPRAFADWRAASEGGVTLAVHRPAGGLPDAVIYSEAFTALADRTPSTELLRFQLTIDPELTVVPRLLQAMLGPRRGLQASADAEPNRELALAEAALALGTRTRGGGIGFTSRPKTFTGWRWIGRTTSGLELRLGRSAGVWGSPKPLAEHALTALDALAATQPQAQAVLDRFAAQLPQPSPGSAQALPERDAVLVIGNIDARLTRAAHLAIVCATPCAVTADLTRLLDSLRLATQAERLQLAQTPGSTSLTALQAELGLPPVTQGLEQSGDELKALLSVF